MLFKRKLGNGLLIGVPVVVVLLGMTSISLAQGDIWTEKAPMPTKRLAFAAAVVDGKIYAIGGTRSETGPLFSKVEVYDPATDTWDTNKTEMPPARSSLGCAVVDGKIYAIGGVSSSIVSTLEVYDPVTDTWTTKAPMPTPRASVSTCAVNGKIYAIGGSKRTGSLWSGLSIVEEYDPSRDTWARKKDMPTRRWALATCVVDGKIYAIGGNIQYPAISRDVEVYDPVTDTWTKKTPMPTARYSLSTSSINGKIFAFGGWRASGGDWGDPMYKIVEEYDSDTGIWIRKTDMPFTIAELSTVALDRKIYLIGGTRTQHPFLSINTVYEYDPASDPTSVEDPSSVHPTEFRLHQNYPNPFNPETRITYEVSARTRVLLKVTNVLGQEVRTLVDEHKPAGFYEVLWDGKDNQGQRVASGVYLYRLELKDFVQTRKMVLLQ
ncbi:MAG: kelch repeat-containing protein [bacterium]